MKRRGSARPRGSSRDHAPRHGAWLSVRVELIEGRGEHLWPRPGRLFAASTNHSFGLLAAAIDDAFARWDRSHLHEFELKDGTRIGIADPDDDALLDEQRLHLSRLKLGDQFVYVFDLGDDWAHLCTVGESSIDPVEALGVLPRGPLPYLVGAIFRTNTEGFGTITTARLRCLPILSSVTYRPSALAGEFPARAIAVGGGSSGWRDYGHAEAPRRGANGRLARVTESAAPCLGRFAVLLRKRIRERHCPPAVAQRMHFHPDSILPSAHL